ncbi:Platelet-activating factor acetylhydrolase-like [Burkholderiaceae bacterium]
MSPSLLFRRGFTQALLCGGIGLSSAFSFAQSNRIDQIRSDAPALAAYGAFDIGVKTLQFKHPNQPDMLNAKLGQDVPMYDRPLTTEIWYPGQADPAAKNAGEYHVFFRDGKTQITLHGKALRDAKPNRTNGAYPLVIMSHGYPGNRFLMSPIAENLASKGYVVASIDHTDSTYSDQGAFPSTLRNRPLDVSFVIDEMVKANRNAASPFKDLIDENRIALIGYSMGGYGVINKLGGGFSDKATQFPNLPKDSLNLLLHANPDFAKRRDPRIKAAVAFAPWGWKQGFWNEDGLKGIQTPMLFIAGSVDDVSGYAPGVRNIYEGSIHSDRYLLTFENANHNAGAPMPPPQEAWKSVPWLPVTPAAHYIDPVWDNVRMNNISQHFIAAFLGKHLEKDAAKAAHLDVLEYAQQGKWSANPDGSFKADHTYWKGFPARTAVGLRLEHLGAAVR